MDNKHVEDVPMSASEYYEGNYLAYMGPYSLDKIRTAILPDPDTAYKRVVEALAD